MFYLEFFFCCRFDFEIQSNEFVNGPPLTVLRDCTIFVNRIYHCYHTDNCRRQFSLSNCFIFSTSHCFFYTVRSGAQRVLELKMMINAFDFPILFKSFSFFCKLCHYNTEAFTCCNRNVCFRQVFFSDICVEIIEHLLNLHRKKLKYLHENTW